MDEYDFFRQATSKICGNLNIEEALFSSLNFLRQKMPVDRMLLELFEFGLESVRTVALASPEKGITVDMLTPMSSAALKEIGQFEGEYIKQSPNSAWLLADDPHQQLMFHEMLQIHNIKATSLLVLPLRMRDKVVGGGGLLLTTEGEKKFTRQDADMLYLLREPFAVAMSNALKHHEVQKLQDLLSDDNRYLHRELRRLSGEQIIGANFGLKDVMEKAGHVASLDSPVLLLGETGVGKDVIANAIHYSSPRKNGPFVSVNCGAIPETLIDSELFGHEKGAFTGALAQKRGRFERADKGTIFLDEIGELPLLAQVRLLKVLQNKEIERVGGVKTIHLDIRIIAATNRDLEKMVKTSDFREDLWFRLNVFPIIIPPLRDRKNDIVALLQHFIHLKTRELKLPHIPEVVPGTTDILMSYDWPGNVRELGNIVERAMILKPSGPLDFTQLFPGIENGYLERYKQTLSHDNLDILISSHIKSVVESTNGKIHGPGGAAEILGVNPSSLRYKMRKYGIKHGRSFEKVE
jgi:transcriptional regulator with GAF, ATPase, and Fis domain